MITLLFIYSAGASTSPNLQMMSAFSFGQFGSGGKNGLSLSAINVTDTWSAMYEMIGS